MKGLLIINLGTPDDPSPRAVKRYLDEFLMDPYVIDIGAVWRFLLVKGIILNTRPKKSAEAYQKIWKASGSPLLQFSLEAEAKLQKLVSDQRVKLAMRYGNPSIASQLQSFADESIFDITVVPLYPQYSYAATTSSIVKIQREAKLISDRFQLKFIEDFYDDPKFIAAFAENIDRSLKQNPWDHLLLSYHGVPERHVQRTDPTGAHCLSSPNCCDRLTEANRYCYRAQCFATSRALAKKLSLGAERYTVSFQSRLGRTPWIKPYTDLVLKELAESGVKDLVVACPAFVADCLETLEEIEMRGQVDFKSFGGTSLRLVPSLNAEPAWIEALGSIATKGAATATPFVR